MDLRIVHNHRHSGDIVSTDFHYLTNDKVAKLFSTNTNKEDVIYKAITQCLNSKIYYDQWSDIPINLEFSEDERTDTLIVKYPIIICENFDNLYNIDFDNGEYSSNQMKDNFQLEINYTYLDKTKTKALTEIFLIDVLNFDNTVLFLDKLEKEIKSIMQAKSFLYMTNHQ